MEKSKGGPKNFSKGGPKEFLVKNEKIVLKSHIKKKYKFWITTKKFSIQKFLYCNKNRLFLKIKLGIKRTAQNEKKRIFFKK